MMSPWFILGSIECPVTLHQRLAFSNPLITMLVAGMFT
ncbi:hypothetical protein EVA_20127 [gut metagenome]|uniref:Uncharacterized protein n=1 Tax=gut metagenome TaxID=749906 RepID=J9FA30_9ZZZZ